jgi:putative ABC transport system permease protein
MLKHLLLLVSTSAKLCFMEILSNKTRSLITSFGILLGVASLLAMLSFVRAMDKDLQENLVKMGGLNILTVENLKAETAEEQQLFRRSPKLQYQQLVQMRQRVPAITDILPQESRRAGDIRSNGRSARARTVAVGLRHFQVHQLETSQGRDFSEEDFRSQAKVCIVGPNVLEELYPDGGDPVGKTISFNNIVCKIIGVVYTKDKHSREGHSIYYPFGLFQDYIGGPNAVLQNVQLEVVDMPHVEAAKLAVEEELLALHRGVKDFDVTTNEEKLAEFKQASMVTNLILLAIALISLVVGCINIMNIMFATIGDRIREIGIRKALGAKKMDIFAQFLIEAILLSCTGGFLGTFLGSIPSFLPKDVFPFEPYLTALDYAVVMGFSVIAGIAAGITPAFKAANLRPVEALQYG